MKKSEKLIIGILTIGLVAVLAVGGTLAYMTDREEKTNTFTVGSLDISLEEKLWEQNDDGEDLVPGDTVVKDPVIKAVENDSYMRVLVTLKDKNGSVITDAGRLALIRKTIRFDSTYDADGQIAGTGLERGKSYTLAELEALPTVNPDFTEVSTGTAGKYCFNYNNVLAEGENVALFTNVAIPTDWSQVQLDVIGAFTIEVSVEAIQAKNFANAAEAFAALDNEISNNTIVDSYDSTH